MKSNDRIILGIGVSSLALLAYGIFPNLGLTYDSHVYLEQANNLSSEDFSQKSFASKPPLMAIVYFLLGGNLTLVAISNVACWVGSMLLLHNIFKNEFEDTFYRMTFSALILFSTPIILVHNFAWTESYYLLMVCSFLYLSGKDDSKNKILLAILLLAMVALKHLGISLVLGFGLVALLKIKVKWQRLWIYAPAVLFFLFWQWKSASMRGDLTRLDHTSNLDILQNLNWIGQTLIHWAVPFEVPAFASIAFVIFLSISLIICLRTADTFKTYCVMIPLSIIAVVATKGDLLIGDMERYLFLAYPFLLFLGLKSVLDFKMPSKWIVRIPLLLLLTYSVIRTVKNCVHWHSIS